MTDTSTLDARRRVTIPRETRDQRGLKSGDKLSFTLLPNGTLVLRPKTLHIEDLVGILRRPGQPTVPIEGMRVALPDADT